MLRTTGRDAVADNPQRCPEPPEAPEEPPCTITRVSPRPSARRAPPSCTPPRRASTERPARAAPWSARARGGDCHGRAARCLSAALRSARDHRAIPTCRAYPEQQERGRQRARSRCRAASSLRTLAGTKLSTPPSIRADRYPRRNRVHPASQAVAIAIGRTDVSRGRRGCSAAYVRRRLVVDRGSGARDAPRRRPHKIAARPSCKASMAAGTPRSVGDAGSQERPRPRSRGLRPQLAVSRGRLVVERTGDAPCGSARSRS